MRSLYLLLTCFLVFAATSLSAQNYIWTGAVDSLWSNVNNWEVLGVPPATLPSPTDNVEILGPSTRPPHVDIVNATCNDFYIEFDELRVNIGQQLSVFGNLELGDGGDVRLLSNARLRIAGNLDNSNSNGNIFSQPGSRVIFFGPGNSAIINPITLFDVTVNKEANARVYNQPRCQNGSVGTPIIIENNLTIDKGVLAIADIDGINGMNQVTPELDVRGNITINNGGCLDLSGYIDNILSCSVTQDLERIRIHLGGNLADNTAPFPPTNVRGFFIGSTTIGATGGRRPVMVFNGVKDQTVLGQYPLTNAANTPNQGSGLWLPRIIIDKPDPAKRVAMLTNVRLYGNAIIRSGVFLLNSKRLLYGENNGDLLDIVLNGTLYANDNSEIYMYANGGGMDGSTLRAYDGGHLKLYGSPDQRVTITRDAPAPGNHYRTAVYSGGRVSSRYADYNFQSNSNAGFNRAKLVGVGALLPVNCACNDPASECYLSQGGMKVFAGAILDPEGLGANFSDCSFSAAANGTTSLLFNVASGIPHELNNLVLNGANETTWLDPQLAFPTHTNGNRQLCNGGTSSTTNIVSNNAGTIILVINSSGLRGGEIFGEQYDAGTRDYRELDGEGDLVHMNNANRIEYPAPGANDHIIFTGRTFAIWIGRGTDNNWNNIDNWSTKEIDLAAIPGTPGHENYTVIIPRGSRLQTGGTGDGTVFQNVPVSINGAMYLNLEYTIPAKYRDNSLGIYPAGTTYTQGAGNRYLQVNSSRSLDINNDLFIWNDGRLNMQNAAPHPTLNVAGNWFGHFTNSQFNRGQSTVTLDGLGVQQIRTGTGNLPAQIPNLTNAFYNLVVNKPSSTLFVQNNNLSVENNYTHTSGEVEFFTGMNLRVDGDFVFNSGNHIWNFSALFFGGNFLNNGGIIMAERSCIVFNAPDNSTKTIRTFNQAFNYIIFRNGVNRTYNLDGNLTVLNSDGSVPLGAQAWFTANNYNSCRIQSGCTVNVNGFVMRTRRFLVEAGGTLNLNAGAGVRGAELLVYGGDDPVSYFTETNNKFIVDGRLNVIGTSAKTSKISRNGIIGRYGIDVNGTISARYALFELFDRNGLDCRDVTTIVDPAVGIGCFSDCIFTNGDATTGSYLLRLPAIWTGTTANITDASFPANSGTGTFNVFRTNGGGTDVTFTNPSGVFAGEDFDDDNGGAATRITWVINNQYRWDGGGDGVSWHDANNWCPNAVPGVGAAVNADVILDHTNCSSLATMNIGMNGVPVTLRDLTIEPGGGNPIRLNIFTNLTVSGQFTNKVGGTFNITSATPNVTFRRTFSNEGQFYNGGLAAVLNFDGIGTNVIYNEPHDSYPFSNLRFMGGVYELNSEVTVERDVQIDFGAIFDASNDNNRLNIAGEWRDNGEFAARFGTVAFVDLPAHSEPLGPGTASYVQRAEPVQYMFYNGANLHETYFNMVLDKYLSPMTHHVQLRDPLLIDGVLDLRQRNLITSNFTSTLQGYIRKEFDNVAILGLFGSWTNASAGSYVDGPLARTYISNVPFTYDFPLGKFDDYVKPVELEIQLATNGPQITRFAMEQFNEPIDTVSRPVPPPCVAPSAGLQLFLLPRFWNVARLFGALGGTANLSQGNIKLVWDNEDGLTQAFEDIRIVKDVGPSTVGHDPKTLLTMQHYTVHSCSPPSAQINGNEQGGEALTLTNFYTLGNGDFGLVYFDNILPVQSLNFEAKYVQNGTQLLWNTQGEVNNAGFILMRAEDQPNGFTEIAHHANVDALKGRGTTSKSQGYSFFDAKALQPGKTYYYQLLSQDVDGSIHSHGVRSVTLPGMTTLGVPYPNPHTNMAHVNLSLAEDLPVTLAVYNLNGQEVARLLDRQPMTTGAYNVPILLPNAPAGVYVLRMQAGSHEKTVRFIKQ